MRTLLIALVLSALASYWTITHLPAYAPEMDPIAEWIRDYESSRIEEQALQDVLETMGEGEK